MSSVVSHITNPSERLKALCEYGSQVEVDISLPIKLYYRSGHQLIRMATVYLDEKNYESAFILYSKYITLFVEKLPKHPDYKTLQPSEFADMKKKMKSVFPLAEELKSQLKKRYIEEEKHRLELEAKEKALREAEEAKKKAEEEERLKEQLAEEERIRTESEEKWYREQEERYRELQLQEQQRLAQLEREKEKGNNSIGLNNERTSIPSGNLDFIPNNLIDVSQSDASSVARTIPQIPDRDLKKKLSLNETNIPVVDRGNKPSFDHFTSIGGFGGGSSRLREVIVSSSIFSQFLVVAKSNTLKNTETLGILFGKLSQNAFHITDIFIPKQHGTSDSCDMENEIDLIEFQDKHNLITLGWIHTHPSQTAFLSSVDMHTHFPYQKMMPESVAIVCSPKYNESGVFRLTGNGLSQIGSCREKGFHYHQKEPPLFEQGENVSVIEGDPVHIEDGRN